jgi:Predicted dehydrogenases and related proteins
MKAAVIGTGGIAHTHADAIRSLGHTVALVVGHSAASAERFAGEVGCPVFTDHLSAAALADVDCVHICTPPENHAALVRACVEAGKNVLCEKPLTLSAGEAEELTALAEERGVLAAVDFNNRFYPACGRVRAAVEELGPVALVQGHYRQEFHILPAPYSWRYTEELRATTEIGSHFIDLMRYLTGLEVEAVSAAFLNAVPRRRLRDGVMYAGGDGEPILVRNEDAVAATFRLTGGALASAVFSEISPGRSNDLSIEISSADRSVSWCSERPYEMVAGRKDAGLTRFCNAFAGGFTDTFRGCFEAFYRAAASGVRDERLATFRDGAANVRICAALAQSARSRGEFVEVES